jgi:hypothetical protein
MMNTVWAVVREGKIVPLEKIEVPEGTRALRSMLKVRRGGPSPLNFGVRPLLVVGAGYTIHAPEGSRSWRTIWGRG